jgi:hypothetical protein
MIVLGERGKTNGCFVAAATISQHAALWAEYEQRRYEDK